MAPFVVAIDGPAGAGKGTLATGVAGVLGFPHLDTGLLYRAVGVAMVEAGLDLDDAEAAAGIAAALDLGAFAVDALRSAQAGAFASRVAQRPGVRAALVAYQRQFAETPPGAVLDGRDIGTVICPEADVKIFVTASAEVRARRRAAELRAAGATADEATVLEEIMARDARDSTRAAAPLRPADDAVLLDTSDLDRDGALLAAMLIIESHRARRAPERPFVGQYRNAVVEQSR